MERESLSRRVIFKKERKEVYAFSPHTYRLTLCVRSESGKGVGKINKSPHISHGFLASAGTSAQVHGCLMHGPRTRLVERETNISGEMKVVMSASIQAYGQGSQWRER